MTDHVAHRPTTVEALAASVIAARSAQLPAAAVEAATDCLIDWVGVTIGGASGVMAHALRRSLPAGGPCRLLGTEQTSGEHGAALVNGTAAHTLELDDIYAPGLFHPGAPVIAAALAVAEATHASGARLLSGIVAGYEVGGRVAADLGPAHYQRFHTTGTAGSLGAAAAAAEVLGLDQDQTAAALSISATLGAGLQQTFRSSAVAKPLHAGHAAHVGVTAARAAQYGASGALDVLDGPVGLGTAMGDTADWSASRTTFGDPYLVEQSTLKAYPCCGHTFAPIDAALAVRDLAPTREISSIVVDTYPAAVDVAGIQAPATGAEARFSIAYTVASAFIDGAVGEQTFGQASLEEPERRRLAGLTVVREDPAFAARAPRARGARLTVTWKDGTRRQHTVQDRSGSPANPLSGEAIEQKFLGLVGAAYDTGRARVILAQLRDVARVVDVSCLDL